MFTTRSFPRAIVHFDADSFFASIEQVMDHTLRGKVVVTGGERGAATSVSYEGKKLGLYRGMSLRDMKRVCPDLRIVSSDYTAYSIYGRRMYQIAREFTPEVEEYSIDECFADITGLRQKFRMPYERIAALMKEKLEGDLGITFGVGLAPNKTLAKIASKVNKPAGLTILPGKEIQEFLKDLPIGQVWGVGGSTSLYLEKLGVRTALQFAEKDEAWFKEHAISKPYRELWLELRGGYVKRLSSGEDESIGSIIKSRTFAPSRDRAYLLSQLGKNIEAACAKARRHKVKGKTCRFYLKTQEFTYHGKVLDLSIALAEPREFLRAVEAHLDDVYEPGTLYRATGFALYSIVADHAVVPDLFGQSARVEKSALLLAAVDAMNHKYGHETVHLGTSLRAIQASEEGSRQRALRSRKRIALSIEERKKTINIPYLGVAH